MIVFDLRCAGDHVFEAWFGSSDAFEDQRARGLLLCPICGVTDVSKSVMAPNIAAKGNSHAGATAPTPGAGDPAAIKAVLSAMAAAQAKALEKSEWVGRAFADRARAMHVGEADRALIHGQATPGEARALAEEGVDVAPLLVPIMPPEALN